MFLGAHSVPFRCFSRSVVIVCASVRSFRFVWSVESDRSIGRAQCAPAHNLISCSSSMSVSIDCFISALNTHIHYTPIHSLTHWHSHLFEWHDIWRFLFSWFIATVVESIAHNTIPTHRPNGLIAVCYFSGPIVTVAHKQPFLASLQENRKSFAWRALTRVHESFNIS